jgi:predicted ATPase
MKSCECCETHLQRRVVLTGGPGAGKTAILELVRQSFCAHVKVLPEAAGILFGGGFPRGPSDEARRAAQRAIFHVQRELENLACAENAAITLCDRGTVDGAAYWRGPGDLFSAVGTTLAQEHARYQTVIHLRTPGDGHGYNQQNPLRVETAAEAKIIDDRIAQMWHGHPSYFVVPSSETFLTKASRALAILANDLPECCLRHLPDRTLTQ